MPKASVVREEVGRRARRRTSIIRATSRFSWFTVEFGSVRGSVGIRAYGGGLLSSYRQLQHAIETDEVSRDPIKVESVINHVAEIDHYQPLLFIVDSFDHLFDLVDRLERWMHEGKRNKVARGLPEIAESDLGNFLEAAS